MPKRPPARNPVTPVIPIARIAALLSQGKEIEALGHDFSIQQETVAPTCTEEGYTIYRCSRCGATEHRDVVPATGHTGELRDAREATCTESGYTGDTYCSVCGVLLQRGESIPPLGHDYEDVVIAPHLHGGWLYRAHLHPVRRQLSGQLHRCPGATCMRRL